MSIPVRLAIVAIAIVACLAVLVASGAGGEASTGRMVAGFLVALTVPAILLIAHAIQRIASRRRAADFRGDQISGDYP